MLRATYQFVEYNMSNRVLEHGFDALTTCVVALEWQLPCTKDNDANFEFP